MPIANNCKPPMKRIIQTRLAQPLTLPPTVSLRTTMKIIPRIEDTKEMIPQTVAIFKRASEKLIKPSREYFNKDQKFHDVSPATRSRLSIVYPTQRWWKELEIID